MGSLVDRQCNQVGQYYGAKRGLKAAASVLVIKNQFFSFGKNAFCIAPCSNRPFRDGKKRFKNLLWHRNLARILKRKWPHS